MLGLCYSLGWKPFFFSKRLATAVGLVGHGMCVCVCLSAEELLRTQKWERERERLSEFLYMSVHSSM